MPQPIRYTLISNILIHCFALAHALTALLLFSTSVGDEIPLTVLTIAMIIGLAKLYECPLDMAAALALLGCFAGFYLGTIGPEIIMGDSAFGVTWIHSLTTAIITEILGWATFVIVKRKSVKKRPGINAN